MLFNMTFRMKQENASLISLLSIHILGMNYNGAKKNFLSILSFELLHGSCNSTMDLRFQILFHDYVFQKIPKQPLTQNQVWYLHNTDWSTTEM